MSCLLGLIFELLPTAKSSMPRLQHTTDPRLHPDEPLLRKKPPHRHLQLQLLALHFPLLARLHSPDPLRARRLSQLENTVLRPSTPIPPLREGRQRHPTRTLLLTICLLVLRFVGSRSTQRKTSRSSSPCWMRCACFIFLNFCVPPLTSTSQFFSAKLNSVSEEPNHAVQVCQ